MLENYLPVLIFIAVGLAVGTLAITFGWLLSPNRPDSAKLSPYECGFEAFEDSRMKFDVRYYLVAILFIIFDLEIAFLFPWAADHIPIVPILIDELITNLVGLAYLDSAMLIEREELLGDISA